MEEDFGFVDLPTLEMKDFMDLKKTAEDMLRQAQMMIIINRQLLKIAEDGIANTKDQAKIPESKISYAG